MTLNMAVPRRWAATAVAAVIVVGMGQDLVLPDDAFANRFVDDAAYYFTIARHAGAGHGLTFDGIHPTNGVQPLWLALIVPIFRFVPGDILPLRIVAALEVGLLAAAAVALFTALRQRLGTTGAFVAAIALAALPRSEGSLRRGMEGALLVLLLVVAWRRTRRACDTDASSDWWVAGILWAAAFLARLEVIVAPFIVIGLRLREMRRHRGAVLAMTLPALVVAAIYMTANYIGFGSLLPVSGLVKSHWGAASSLGEHLRAWVNLPWALHDVVVRFFGCGPFVTTCQAPVTVGYVVIEGVLLVLVLRHRRALLAAIRESTAGPLLLICAVLVSIDLVVVVNTALWKEAPIILGSALLAGIAASRLPRQAPALAAVFCALILARAGKMVTDHGGMPGDNFSIRVQAGHWLRDHLPAGTTVGAWNAGMLGYFSHQPVVNLDGLVNDLAFFNRVVKGGDLAGYLDDENIRWLADLGCTEEPRPRPFLAPGHAVDLDSGWEVVTSVRRPMGAGCLGYTVWRSQK